MLFLLFFLFLSLFFPQVYLCLSILDVDCFSTHSRRESSRLFSLDPEQSRAKTIHPVRCSYFLPRPSCWWDQWRQRPASTEKAPVGRQLTAGILSSHTPSVHRPFFDMFQSDCPWSLSFANPKDKRAASMKSEAMPKKMQDRESGKRAITHFRRQHHDLNSQVCILHPFSQCTFWELKIHRHIRRKGRTFT